MRTVLVIVALLLGLPRAAAADPWHLDVGATALAEAWDRNERREWVAGAIAGLDRRLWRGVWARAEGLALHVAQPGADAWLGGFTLGPRFRWGTTRVRRIVDVAVGASRATTAVPLRGTEFNYLALIGAGVEVPLPTLRLSVTGRWWHASNNGREGRHRNPDIQALGVVVALGTKN
jgi:hypothetical protein